MEIAKCTGETPFFDAGGWARVQALRTLRTLRNEETQELARVIRPPDRRGETGIGMLIGRFGQGLRLSRSKLESP